MEGGPLRKTGVALGRKAMVDHLCSSHASHALGMDGVVVSYLGLGSMTVILIVSIQIINVIDTAWEQIRKAFYQ